MKKLLASTVFLLVVSLIFAPPSGFAIKLDDQYPAASKGKPTHFDMKSEPKIFEDLFMPRTYSGNGSYTFTIPSDLETGYLFSLSLDYKKYIEEGPLANELKKKFEGHNLSLPSNAKLSYAMDEWHIIEPQTCRGFYHIENYSDGIYIYDTDELYGYSFLFGGDYQYGYATSDNTPPDYKPANITIETLDGNVIFSCNNIDTKIGHINSKCIGFPPNATKVKFEYMGQVTFWLTSAPNWGNMFYEDQNFDFNGALRTYPLYGIAGEISGVNPEEEWMKLKLRAQRPFRVYIYTNFARRLVNYDESWSKEKILPLATQSEKFVPNNAWFTIVTQEGNNKQLNGKFRLKTVDYPTPWGKILLVTLGVFGPITVAVAWYYRKS